MRTVGNEPHTRDLQSHYFSFRLKQPLGDTVLYKITFISEMYLNPYIQTDILKVEIFSSVYITEEFLYKCYQKSKEIQAQNTRKQTVLLRVLKR